MDYEKLYKEALSRAKNLRKDAIDKGENLRAKQCEIIFPELKGSGYEIPQKLHNLLCAEVTFGQFRKHNLTVDSALDWLEKAMSK